MSYNKVRFLASALSVSVIALRCSPAWSQNPSAAPSEAVPATWFVYGVIIVVLVAALLAILLIRAAVSNSNWSLADALSEESEITAMTGPTGAQVPMLDPSQKPIMVTVMRASSSRMIALMGMLVILLMFLGFGSFALYRFAMTGGMPDGIDKVINFLAAGMTLFAPYLVNKFSSLFEGLSPRR